MELSGNYLGVEPGWDRILPALTALTALGLADCSERLARLPLSLTALRRLRRLDASFNERLGWGAIGPLLPLVGLPGLPPQAVDLLRLRELALGENRKWSGGDVDEYQQLEGLETLAGATQLTRLGLDDCALAALPPGLSAMQCLEELDLSGNPELGAGGGEGALAPLSEMRALRRLDISGCPHVLDLPLLLRLHAAGLTITL